MGNTEAHADSRVTITKIDPRLVFHARTALWDVRQFAPLDWQSVLSGNIALPPEEEDPRFVNCNAGRGAGKTTYIPQLMWEGALTKWNDALVVPHVKLFSDTYEHGKMIWDTVWDEARTILSPIVYAMDGERNIITLKSSDGSNKPGATMQLLSADNPKAMTGHNKTTLGVSDESQFVKDEAWRQFYPCLNLRRGVMVAFGVCQGKGWYRTNSLRGLSKYDWHEYITMSVPSTSNPNFRKAEELLAQREYSDIEFRQLFMAEWMFESGSVFENIESCIVVGEPIMLKSGELVMFEPPQPGALYSAGVDIAKVKDFLACAILNRSTGRLAALYRNNKRTYTFMEAQVADALISYAPLTFVDATGLGSAPYDSLVKTVQEAENSRDLGRGANSRRTMLHPVTLTTTKRSELLDHLALALIRERIRFRHVIQLVDELKMFEKTVTPSGSMRLAAPEGLHDDLVFALALAAQGINITTLVRPGSGLVKKSVGWDKLPRSRAAL